MLRAYRLYIVYHTCGALSREFFYRLAVGLLSAAGTRMPWHPVPSRAFWLYLQYRLLMTCSRLISYVFYKETALGFGFYSDFTSGEYHIALVDFIVALRRTKGRGRRTLRSPPSPSSGLHLIHPGDPLRRGITAAAVDRDFGFRCPVQVDNPQFRILFGCFVFGL